MVTMKQGSPDSNPRPAAPAAGPATEEDERPPVFRTWPRLYLAVLGNLMLLIAIFYIITRLFA